MKSTQAVAWQLNSQEASIELGVEGIRAARLPQTGGPTAHYPDKWAGW